VMGWVSAWDYERAKPDPLADVATGIMQHMNTDHGDALIVLAWALALQPAARPFSAVPSHFL
jgi:hypothetical protein